MTSALSGKSVLITGAGRGIGAALAGGFAREGATLTLVARTAQQLQTTADRVRALVPDAQVRLCAMDIAVDSERDRGLGTLLADGGIDVLINNAGVVEPLGTTASLTPDAVRRAFDVNVVGPMMLSAMLAPRMVTGGWGRIINVSSGVVAHPASMIGGGTYAATKAALEAHTLNLAAELAGTGVTVNVYRPGGVDTEMQQWIREQDPQRIGAGLRDRFTDRFQSGQLISADDSAAALLQHLVVGDAESTGAIWDVEKTVRA